MSPEQQRIAIAEACGWEFKQSEKCPEQTLCRHPEATPGDGWWAKEIVPDYLNDLNAMHEAEMTLTEKQRVDYSSATYDFACSVQEKTGHWNWISLSAANRAEAFLRVTGRWTGGEP